MAIVCTEAAYNNFFNEAHYRPIPRFGESSKLKALYDAVDEAKEFMESKGEINSNADAIRIQRKTHKICMVVQDICSLSIGISSGLAALSPLVGILSYLIWRLIDWLQEQDAENNGIQYAQEVLSTYKAMRSSGKFKKKEDLEKIDQEIHKLERFIDKFS